MNNYKENSKDSRQSKNVIGFNSKLLKSDIRKNALPISAVAGLLEVINLIFGKICIVRMLFGIPCPGCGITRAFQFLLQGKIAEAVYIHPFWVAIVVLFFGFFFNRYFIREKNISKRIIHILKICTMIAAVLCVGYYGYRMITWYPEKAPMVYDSENLLQQILKMGFNRF